MFDWGEGIEDGITVPKGYIYFAVFFSLVVKMLNMKLRRKSKPVHLHQRNNELVAEAAKQKE